MSKLLGSLKSKYKDWNHPGARSSIDDPLGLTSLTAGLGSFIASDGLARIPAKYYLEFRYGEEIIATMVFPYDPTQVQYNRSNPIRTNYTLGGVMREVNTIRRHDITLTGRTGLAQRSGYTRNGGIVYAEGETLFREMDEFFKRYIEISTQEYGIAQNLVPINPVTGRKQMTGALGGNQAKAVKLILRCIEEDLHLVVEPMGFSWSKDANSNRHDYIWRCDFVGYDYTEVKRGPFDFVIDTVNNQVNAIGGLVSVGSNVVNNISNDYVSPIRDSIRNVGSIFQATAQVLDSVGGLAQNVYGIGSDLARVTSDFGLIGSSWDNLKGSMTNFSSLTDFYPFALIGENIGEEDFGLRDAKIQLDRSISALKVKSEPITGVSDYNDSEAGKVITLMNDMNSLGEKLRGSIPKEIYDYRIQNPSSLTATVISGEFLANEENLGLLSGNNPHGILNDRGRRTNVITHTMARDEDLISLAIKYLGDADRWEEIKNENDWRDHRRNATGNYFEIGEQIFIPVSFLPNANPFGDPTDPIGVDIAMPLGDIEFTDTDIRMVEGRDNVLQLIKNALLTRIGELPGFEEFGLVQNQAVGNLVYGAAILRNMLIGDPRIVDVTDLELQIIDDTLIVDCKVKTIQNETIPIRAEV